MEFFRKSQEVEGAPKYRRVRSGNPKKYLFSMADTVKFSRHNAPRHAGLALRKYEPTKRVKPRRFIGRRDADAKSRPREYLREYDRPIALNVLTDVPGANRHSLRLRQNSFEGACYPEHHSLVSYRTKHFMF
jgi:hypothetical protein